MDIVTKYKAFSLQEIGYQLQVKQEGRPTPDLNIDCSSQSQDFNYSSRFNPDVYSKYDWICGCAIKNGLFCFPCVLFDGDPNWTSIGVTDLVHLSDKAKLHENSKQHLTNEMRLVLLGKSNIEEQLDSAYWRTIAVHNETVTKNSFALSKIINAIIFCRAFELSFKDRKVVETVEGSSGSQGVIDYLVELDKTLKEHLESTVFEGTSEDIRDDFLDCIFEVYREVVSAEIDKADFLGIIAEQTTDACSKLRTIIVFRYVKDGKPAERFWGFFTIDSLSSVILTELEPLIGNNRKKLIAQSYDGATVTTGRPGEVISKVKKIYPLAHFVHCHAHKLNVILAQVSSQNEQVRLFFYNLSNVATFLSQSSQYLEFLQDTIDRRLRASLTAQEFGIRCVNIIYEYKDQIVKRIDEMATGSILNNPTKNQTAGIREILQEKAFVLWLSFFHYVMPHVDILSEEFQKRIIDTAEVDRCVRRFKEHMAVVKNQIIDTIIGAVEVHESKRRKINEANWNRSARKVCDVMASVIEDRFKRTDQLNAVNLFICEKFESYNLRFPLDYLTQTVKSYPVLEKQRLKTELTVLYSSTEFRNVSSCAILLNFLVDNKLRGIFQETIKLLQILVTMPMTSVEGERDCSTLKRIKKFLGSTAHQDRLEALACLSVEQKLVRSIPDFSERVIDKYALKKNRQNDLIFKKQ